MAKKKKNQFRGYLVKSEKCIQSEEKPEYGMEYLEQKMERKLGLSSMIFLKKVEKVHYAIK